jgi:hypothetical protein
MKSTSLVTIRVFVAGLGIGYFARSAGIGTAKKADTHAAVRYYLWNGVLS